jgi:hypothetical protein
MTENFSRIDDDLFYKYETLVVDDATDWFKTQASVMSNYDIVHIRLVSSFEILMHVRVLRCPEVGKLYITYIKGVYINEDNYKDPFRFGLDDVKGSGAGADGGFPMTYAGTSFMAEVRRALHALFPGDCEISLYDQDEFKEMRKRVLLRDLCIIRRLAAPVALHQSVMGCIWENCKPDWYDFDYETQLPVTMKVWIGVYVYDEACIEV